MIGIDITRIARHKNQHEAGMWAAKEAVFKATGQWAEIYHVNSRPCSDGVELSITHDGDYAVAVAVKREMEKYK